MPDPRRSLAAGALATSLFFLAPVALADPPIWESSFGSQLAALTGADDAETSVVLSFNFPFDGTD